MKIAMGSHDFQTTPGYLMIPARKMTTVRSIYRIVSDRFLGSMLRQFTELWVVKGCMSHEKNSPPVVLLPGQMMHKKFVELPWFAYG